MKRWTDEKDGQKGERWTDEKMAWTDEKDGQKGERSTEERYARKRVMDRREKFTDEKSGKNVEIIYLFRVLISQYKHPWFRCKSTGTDTIIVMCYC